MSGKSSDARRMQHGLITGLIVLAMAVVIIALQLAGSSSEPSTGQRITLEPQIVANLTQLPQATPLSGDSARQINELKALVETCPDYTPARRNQMEQHIAWLITPAQIPADIIIALGANPTGKLIFGMATYTSIQWNLINRPPDSCLLPIGDMLNEMLVAAGEDPFPIFNET